MSHASVKAGTMGLVLTGGGARAAYQVGVLRALAQIVPRGSPSPFQVLCGTSAGAINATALAADAGNFRRAVRRLVSVWRDVHAGQVYRADVLGVLACLARWLTALVRGGVGRHGPVSLLDNRPLAALLRRTVDLAGVQRSIEAGTLAALAVTVSGYGSGQSISFFQGREGLQGWERARRSGVATPIDLQHLMASVAIPFVFPPVAIGKRFYGDGSMRQIAPLSPSIHLGVDRVLVVSVSRTADLAWASGRVEACPSLAQIAGHALESIFINALDADLERLDRINRTIATLDGRRSFEAALPLKRIDYLLLSPSEEIDRIAMRHVRALPPALRLLLRGIGAMRRGGSSLASYVLFERPFCRALIALGYRDTLARTDEVRAFLRLDDPLAAAKPRLPPPVHGVAREAMLAA